MLKQVRTFSLIAAMVTLAGALGGAPSAMAAARPGPAAGEIGYIATAYGSELSVSGEVQSGRSALSVLGCTSTAGITHTNTVASVSTPELGTGTINTSAASQTTATGVASAASATTQGASLLGGLVSATTVQSVSTTSLDTSTHAFSTSAAGTEFAGLSVTGIPISGTPAPNTKITLPGVGYVILNQQSGHVGKHNAGLTVIGIHVVVTLSTPLAPVGTNIVVSVARSALGGPFSGLLDGQSYGASAYVGSTVLAGPEFPQWLPCFGTDGVTKTNTGVGLNILGELTSGTVTDTAEGAGLTKTPSATVTSTVQGLDLGSGLVTATAVEADVSATGNPPTLTNNSQFVGLTVTGFPGIGDDVPPNTELPLAGIGTLWLDKQRETATSITVTMVQLDVTSASNPLGLSAGTVVNVARATVSIK